jgi:hypothetical protein
MSKKIREPRKSSGQKKYIHAKEVSPVGRSLLRPVLPPGKLDISGNREQLPLALEVDDYNKFEDDDEAERWIDRLIAEHKKENEK